jgi:hypothetical protein
MLTRLLDESTLVKYILLKEKLFRACELLYFIYSDFVFDFMKFFFYNKFITNLPFLVQVESVRCLKCEFEIIPTVYF